MQKYLMLAGFNREGNANVKAIGERFANLQRNYERFGGGILESYGAVGDYDVVILFEAPDLAAVKKIDMAGKLPGMVDTKILPLFAMEDYRAMIEEL